MRDIVYDTKAQASQMRGLRYIFLTVGELIFFYTAAATELS
jgi:hypothetical protein